MKTLLILLLLASTAVAQDIDLSLSGSFNQQLQSQQFVDRFNPGIGFTAGVGIPVSNRLHTQVLLGYTFFTPNEQPEGVGNVSILSFGQQIRYQFTDSYWFNPYLLAGYSLVRYASEGVRFQLDGPSYSDQTDSHFTTMAIAGGGVASKPFGAFTVFVEGSTSYAFTEIKSTLFASGSIGVRYRL